jgi:hypothetical protein
MARYKSCGRDVRLFVSLVVLDCLRGLGAVNPALQKFIVHNLQPLVLGALFLFGMILAQHPYSFIGVAVLLLLVGVWSFFSSSSREVADGTAAASVPSTTTTVMKKGEVESKERAEEKVQESSREQTPPSFPSSPRRVGVSVSHETGLVDLRRGAVLLGEFDVNASQSQDEGGVHVHGDRRGGVQLEPPTLCEESDRSIDRESEGDSEGDSSDSDRSVSGCGSSDSVWDINGGDLLSDSSPDWSSDSDSSSLSSTAS